MKKAKIKSLAVLTCLSIITLVLGNYPLLDDQLESIIEVLMSS